MATYSDQFARFRYAIDYAAARGYDAVQIMMPNRAFSSCIGFIAGLMISGVISFQIAAYGVLMILSTYSSQAVYNNIRDIEGDRINAPGRPLARGALSVSFAWTLMVALILLGFFFAALGGPLLLVANAGFIALGVIYSRFTKAMGMLSYVTLVTTHIVLPLFVGYVLGNGLDLRIFMIAAFLYATEVLAISIKDYKDVEGDAQTGIRTLPVALGLESAAKLTFAGMCLPLLLVWIPAYFLGVSAQFLAIYLVSGAIRIAMSKKLLSNPTPETATQILKNYRYTLMLQMLAWCLA